MIFETDRLIVRKLRDSDLIPYHEMQSNAKVMEFVAGEVQTIDAHEIELKQLLLKYDIPNNDFWIYAIERKKDHQFIGTLAFVKDDQDDEIGYRLLEKYWNFGFGSEIVRGAVSYCKSLGLDKLIAYVSVKNSASIKILEKNNFKEVAQIINDKQQKEIKIQLIL